MKRKSDQIVEQSKKEQLLEVEESEAKEKSMVEERR